MTPSLQFILALSTLIAAARLGGALSKRLGQPAVLGELLAGVLLGPSLLNYYHLAWFTDTHLSEAVKHLADLGVIFLMFLAGLEIDLAEMTKTGRAAILAGVLGVFATLLLALGVVMLFGASFTKALFFGIALTATSVGISAQTLMELGVLRRRESLTLLGAAVVDDLLVLLVLSVFLALMGVAGGWPSVLAVFVRLVIFIVVIVGAGLLFIPHVTDWVEHLPIAQGLTSFVIVTTLAYAWAAEALGGIAAITGAFLVGLAFARSPLRQEIEHNFAPLVYGLFVPLFFVSIGLDVNLRALGGQNLLFALALIVVVAVSKILGGGLGALWGGLTRGEAFRLGLGMISRGEVVLIVASVGLAEGFLDSVNFVEIVLVVLTTMLVTPVLLRWAYSKG
jgi:Kef-type K+ transport system membrane component KefB